MISPPSVIMHLAVYPQLKTLVLVSCREWTMMEHCSEFQRSLRGGVLKQQEGHHEKCLADMCVTPVANSSASEICIYFN